jgi:hypothetical protein
MMVIGRDLAGQDGLDAHRLSRADQVALRRGRPHMHVMPVIFLSFRPALVRLGSSVTMGALLCMLLICA